MSKNRFSIVIASAFILTCIGAGAAAAQEMGPPPGGPMMMMGGPPPLMMALRAAGLSDAQKQQVHDIMASSRSTVGPLIQQMHSIREQIADKLASPGTLTTSDMTPLLTQQSQIQQQLDSQMIATAIQIRGVLTADQLSKVAAANDKLKQIHSQIESILGPPDGPPAP